MKRRMWLTLGRGARVLGYVIFSAVIISAPFIWAAHALWDGLARLVRPRRFPVIPVPERSPDDDKAEWALGGRKRQGNAVNCQSEGGCSVREGCSFYHRAP